MSIAGWKPCAPAVLGEVAQLGPAVFALAIALQTRAGDNPDGLAKAVNELLADNKL